MPNLFRISYQGRPPPLGVPGLSLIWLLPPYSTPPLRSRPSPGLLILSYSPAIAVLPCYNPEFAPPGSPLGSCVMKLDALSPLLMLAWLCLPYCIYPRSYTTLLTQPVCVLLPDFQQAIRL